MVAYNCQKDAVTPEEEASFDPRNGKAVLKDHGWKRWMRGYKKKWYINTFDMIYSLASLATAGLGIWAAVLGMKTDFAETPITPFTCKNPAG